MILQLYYNKSNQKAIVHLEDHCIEECYLPGVPLREVKELLSNFFVPSLIPTLINQLREESGFKIESDEPEKHLYHIWQNNSGGHFEDPAHHVFVIAESDKQMEELCSPFFKFCSGSYDSCNCCDCCGHRWTKPWGSEPKCDVEHYIESIENYEDAILIYDGGEFKTTLEIAARMRMHLEEMNERS